MISKLDKVITQNRDAVYMNYLGYILIDHDIDLKKGMKYIREALKKKPNSGYYLDSLAWGYYKLGQCHKARKIMLKVMDLEGGNAPEILLHVKKINAWIKKEKRHNKK